MTFEEWFNSYVARNGKIIEGLARADAWDAAYKEGQKAMRQRVKDALDGADTISELIDVIVAIDDIPIEGECDY